MTTPPAPEPLDGFAIGLGLGLLALVLGVVLAALVAYVTWL